MSTRQANGPGELAGRREWIGLALLALPALLVAVDITALFLALPRLSAGLHASSVQQLWITDSYRFLVAGFVITMGTLAGAAAASTHLPAAAAAGLLDVARAAFTSGLHVTAVVTAVIFAGIALLIAVVRPGRPPAPGPGGSGRRVRLTAGTSCSSRVACYLSPGPGGPA
jgi:hypothetical protein